MIVERPGQPHMTASITSCGRSVSRANCAEAKAIGRSKGWGPKDRGMISALGPTVIQSVGGRAKVHRANSPLEGQSS